MNAITFTGVSKSYDAVRAVEALDLEIGSGGLWMSVSILPRTLRHIAHWTPSNRFADLGWSVVAGHTPPASDALVLAAWTAGLGALAIAAYRRATVRSS